MRGDGGDAQIGSDADDVSVTSSRNAWVDGGDSCVGEGGGAGAEQCGGEVADDLVDGTGGDEGSGEGGAAFEEDGADAALRAGSAQQCRHVDRPGSAPSGSRTTSAPGRGAGVGVLGDRDQGGRGVVQDPGAGPTAVPRCRRRPAAAGRRRRRRGRARWGSSARSGAGADDDGVALGAQPVDVGAGLGRGDPAAGAVRRRRSGRRGWPRTSSSRSGRPRRTEVSQAVVARLGLGAPAARLDLDAGRAQGVGAAVAGRVRVGDRVDDAGDPGLDQRLGAGAGAAGVVAGFEGDVRRCRRGPRRRPRAGRGPRRAGRRPAGASPRPRRLPEASRITQPTTGLGLVEPSPRAASAMARCMAAMSAAVATGSSCLFGHGLRGCR